MQEEYVIAIRRLIVTRIKRYEKRKNVDKVYFYLRILDEFNELTKMAD